VTWQNHLNWAPRRLPIKSSQGKSWRLIRWLRPITFAVAMIATLFGQASVFAADQSNGSSIGLDVSWPQCKSGIPVPIVASTFAVVGVTGGRAFTSNPCLAEELRWSSARGLATSLYVNVNYPSGPTADRGRNGPSGACRTTDTSCLAFNYGYNDAQDAFANVASKNAIASTWWLDVETMSNWSRDTAANAQVIAGAVRFFDDHQLRVGIYSVADMWREIAGSASFGLPIWVAQTNHNTPLLNYCLPNYGFAGGTALMVQTWNGQFDVDRGCTNVLAAARGPSAAVGSASSPLPLVAGSVGSLSPTEGGRATYYTIANSKVGSEQTVTVSFWPHGPDTSSGLYLSLYQRGLSLAEVHGIDATTPGLVKMTFSSRDGEPFVLRLTDYNSPSATPIQYALSRSGA
jgi:hypothetical protein